MTLLTLETLFVICGLFLGAVDMHIAWDRAHPARWGSAVFWGVLAVIFAAGPKLPAVAIGYAVVGLAVLAALGQVKGRTSEGEAPGEKGGRTRGLVGPVLLVPAIAVVGGLFLADIRWATGALVEARAVSQIALGLGCLIALAWALRLTRERPVTAVVEGGRLLQAISWTLILPQVLAALGGILARAGVGEVVAQGVAVALPVQSPFIAVVAYCAGMAGFTILLGNAFAAFPIVTLGVGLPFVVQAHGGNPAIMGALGMLSGYCGTLVTPMAANFNLVPVRLLGLRSDYAVIRAQAPFAIAIWIFNVAVMYASVYRFRA